MLYIIPHICMAWIQKLNLSLQKMELAIQTQVFKNTLTWYRQNWKSCSEKKLEILQNLWRHDMTV